jgi:AcrR family transcriptional regulator
MKEQAKTSRIEKRKTEFRDKITQTALRLFEENGVAETSIASIIKEADIAHKTFFNHFPSKDHLLQHIVNSNSHHAYTFFRDALKRSDDPKKRLEYCFVSIAKALEPLDPQRYRDLLTFYFISNASTKAFRDEQKQNWSELVNQILRDAQTQKRLRPGFELETLSEMIVGIFVATLVSWSMEENYPIVSKMKKAVKFINESIFTEN